MGYPFPFHSIRAMSFIRHPEVTTSAPKPSYLPKLCKCILLIWYHVSKSEQLMLAIKQLGILVFLWNLMPTNNPSVLHSIIFLMFKFNVKINIRGNKHMHILYICHAFVPWILAQDLKMQPPNEYSAWPDGHLLGHFSGLHIQTLLKSGPWSFIMTLRFCFVLFFCFYFWCMCKCTYMSV